jgi:hypothetical protein
MGIARAADGEPRRNGLRDASGLCGFCHLERGHSVCKTPSFRFVAQPWQSLREAGAELYGRRFRFTPGRALCVSRYFLWCFRCAGTG